MLHRRRSLVPVTVLLALSLVTASCGGGNDDGATATTVAEATVKQGGTITYGADQEPTGFNNNTSANNGSSVANVLVRVYPSAFRVTPTFTPVIDDELLDSAELTSEDPQTVVYKINKKAVWSDGTPINADDFIYMWQMMKGDGKDIDGTDADTAQTAGYEDIKTVTGSDGGKTVTVVYKKPYADWKGLFSLSIAPAHIGKKVGWNTGFNKFDPATILSGGPFKIQSYNPGRDLTLVRNEKYWGEPAKLDSIVFRFISLSAQQVPALQNREIDVIYPQPQLDAVAQVKGIAGVESEIGFGLQYEHLTFNTKNEFLATAEVRKAIALALDRPDIVKRTVAQFDAKAQIIGSRIYVNNQPEYEDHGGVYAKPDAAGAKKLLEGAGFALGADGIYAKDGKKLSLRLSTTAGNALREQQGVLIQAQLKPVGIDIRIDNSPNKVLFGTRLPTGDFDIGNFAWISSPFPSAFKDIFGTGKDTNYGQFSDPAIDKEFDEANAELDDAKKADLYNAIDKGLWAGMATLPLYQKPTFVAYRNTYANIGDNATNYGVLWNADDWGLKA